MSGLVQSIFEERIEQGIKVLMLDNLEDGKSVECQVVFSPYSALLINT